MGTATAAILGALLGAAIVLIVFLLRRRSDRTLAGQAEAQRTQDLQAVLEQVRTAFGDLSQQALIRNNEQFLQLAETKLSAQARQGETSLEARKQLIDQTVQQITAKLAEVGQSLQTLERDRRESHGSLVQKLENAAQATARLQDTTARLREALANPQRRGQWGERMAEDVLRLAGFIEGVNYHKQTVIEAGSRPDFTFPLPPNRRVNMDVKFPLPNYLQYLDAPDDAARELAKGAFLRDVRNRIKEVTTREYIDPDQGTVDYVLVFIPNEQVYGFIHEHDPTLLDAALRDKVVLCSPLTLYALLAVIRQAAENFHLDQASLEIRTLLGGFSKEWTKYTEVMDRMGKSLEQAAKCFHEMATTRRNKLERQLDKIEDLRSQEHIPLSAESGEG